MRSSAKTGHPVVNYNATFRGALSPLVRRGRAIARGAETLTTGMYLLAVRKVMLHTTSGSLSYVA